MGLKLLAGRWFDPNRPMDDMTLGFPIQKEQEIAYARRGVNVVLNNMRRRSSASGLLRTRSERSFAANYSSRERAWSISTSSVLSATRDSAQSDPDRPDHVPRPA